MFDGAALAEARCSARRADALALCPSPAVEDPHLLCAAFAVSWDLESTESLWSMRWHVMLNLHSAVVKGGDHPATAHHLAWTLASRYGYASLPYGARSRGPSPPQPSATLPPHTLPRLRCSGAKRTRCMLHLCARKLRRRKALPHKPYRRPELGRAYGPRAAA